MCICFSSPGFCTNILEGIAVEYLSVYRQLVRKAPVGYNNEVRFAFWDKMM